jgi:Mn2+/Fe2+ NRAMP family transporter
MRLPTPWLTAAVDADAPETPAPRRGWRMMALVGPGLAVAATGVGAGDMVAASVAGSRYGLAIAWAAILGAVLKFALTEGLARWQLATGRTLLEGWSDHLGRWVQYAFLVYLVIWSFIVGGALISACGLAAHAIAPGLSLETWGILHAIVAAVVVVVGGYGPFERLIKIFIGIMFVSLVGCAWWVAPADMAGRALAASGIPEGGVPYLLGVIGGVGGSVTLLSYGYWIRERRWEGTAWLGPVRLDLTVAYVLTGIFGLSVVVLAARVLHADGVVVGGSEGVLHMARMLESVLGPVGHWTFLVGFWGAVATSMLGVWQGVPYLFCDFVALLGRGPLDRRRSVVSPRSWWYRIYLFWLAVPPMVLLYFDRPVLVVVAYSVLGALFMPFLAATLLILNTRCDEVAPAYRNRWPSTAALALCLVLFGYLGITEIASRL